MQTTWALHTVRDWVPVLMFHEVVPDDTDPVPAYAVTQSRLREILGDFTARGYKSGTLEDVVRCLNDDEKAGTRRERKRRDKRLVLTFDDGTSDFLANALPVLQEYNFSAALFIVTGMVGGTRAWNDLQGRPSLTSVPMMSAQQLRMLHGMGFMIGAHTVSHRSLPGLSTEEAREEIIKSRQALSDLLGSPVKWFAYPYLAASELTRALVSEAGYEGACGGPHQKHSRFYLNRIDASLYNTPQLRLRCNGLYQMTRLAVRQVRHSISSRASG